MFVVLSCERERSPMTPAAIAAYIASAYWFTASTSFANPAVTVVRDLTSTFAGIDPAHIAPFVAAQDAGAGLALLVDLALMKWS